MLQNAVKCLKMLLNAFVPNVAMEVIPIYLPNLLDHEGVQAHQNNNFDKNTLTEHPCALLEGGALPP